MREGLIGHEKNQNERGDQQQRRMEYHQLLAKDLWYVRAGAQKGQKLPFAGGVRRAWAGILQRSR